MTRKASPGSSNSADATRIHHDMPGNIGVPQFLGQLGLGIGKRHLAMGDFSQALNTLRSTLDQHFDPLVDKEIGYWIPVAENHGRYPEEQRQHPVPPRLTALSDVANEVRRFCSLLTAIPDKELMADWPGTAGDGGWIHYSDCLREVTLGIYQTLIDTGNEATRHRIANSMFATQAQLILQHWQTSYRTLQGTILGLRLTEWDRQHLHENYSLGKQRTIRNNIVHCVMAEFWAHGSAIRNARSAYAGRVHDGSRPVDVTWAKYGPPPANFGSVDDLLQTWETCHRELVEEFAQIDDKELDYSRSWWEGSNVSVRFRLNRLGWHLQDHAGVIETICERIGRKRSETERLAVRIYTALGSAEGAMIGMSVTEQDDLFKDSLVVLRNKANDLQPLYAKYWAGQLQELADA